MRTTSDFDPQDATETEPFTINFVNDIPPGDSIVVSPAPTATINVMVQTANGALIDWTSSLGTPAPDPNYLTRLLSTPSTFDGTLVTAWVSGCQFGCQYKLTYTVTTALGRSITLFAYILPETSP